jgi:CD109 antigen
MLMSRQLGDGSFETDDFLIHKEMDGGLENVYAMTAYTANALAEYDSDLGEAALDRAVDYLDSNIGLVWDDAYSLSIATVALFRGGYSSDAERILDRLIGLAVIDESGMHWEPYAVETTGYVATALLLANEGQGRPEAQQALEWLSSQRNSLGGYGSSTQDTVVALRALFLAAKKIQRDLDVQLTVWHGKTLIAEFYADETTFDLLQQAELPTDLGILELQSEGTGSVSFQWVQRYHVPGQLLPPPRNLILDVDYQTAHVQVDDVIDVQVALEYTGEKEKTGMVILDVGVPTGFEPVNESLQELVTRELVQRTEVAGRKVIIYIESLESGEAYGFAFRIRALYPVRAKGVTSSAYEYYDSSVIAYDRLNGIEVGSPSDRPEVRRDSVRRRSPRSDLR